MSLVDETATGDTRADRGLEWNRQQEAGYRWVEQLLARFQYKPGWYIIQSRLPESADSIRLLVRFTAPDSRDSLPEGLPISTNVTGTFDVPHRIWMPRDEAEFWVWLHRALEFMERHELDEWFRIDGELLNDPHKMEKVFRG